MKKILLAGLLVISLMLSVIGCGSKDAQIEGEYQVYYLNKDGTKLNQRGYDTEQDTDAEIFAKEMIGLLSSDSGDVEYRKSIPADVTVDEISLDDTIVSVSFSENYNQVSAIEDVLCRASIVRTLCQYDGITAVRFFVDGSSLHDKNGTYVGAMTPDDFVDNPGEQINAIQEASLTLYFSNATGDGLVKEEKNVYYSSNISMEKLIVEKLMDGPSSANAKAVIPEGTKLLSVSVVDDTCYLTFDSGFQQQDYEVQEGVVIYAIVDSLTELDSIKQVQISVNGDTSGVYRDSFSLDVMYERNMTDYPVQ